VPLVKPQSRPEFRILTSTLRLTKNAVSPAAPGFDVHSVVGHQARATAGLATAAIAGIRSRRAVCARRAFTSGLPRSVCAVPAGRHILIGIRTDKPIAIPRFFDSGGLLRSAQPSQGFLSVEWSRFPLEVKFLTSTQSVVSAGACTVNGRRSGHDRNR
jgi:hypothetical protein